MISIISCSPQNGDLAVHICHLQNMMPSLKQTAHIFFRWRGPKGKVQFPIIIFQVPDVRFREWSKDVI